MKINKRFVIILIVLVTVLSGFLRQYVMVNISWVLKYLTLGIRNYAQSEFHFLVSWRPIDIIRLKWGLTIVWTIYFFLLTYIGIKYIFPNKPIYLRMVKVGYIGLVGVSGIVYLVGYLLVGTDSVYDTVRSLMGVAQSFIPLMVFYLVIKFMLNKNGYSD